jgi:hypothetical protein
MQITALADTSPAQCCDGGKPPHSTWIRAAFWAPQFAKRLLRRRDRACQEQSQDTIAVAATGYFEQDVLARS